MGVLAWRWRTLVVLLFAPLVAACGLVVAFDDYETDARLFAVRGDVTGLDGARVTLLLNGASIETGDGPFASAAGLKKGAAYAVSVVRDPPGHACAVENGTGTIGGGDVVGVRVACPSTEALLTDLRISAAPLVPAFASGTSAYSASFRARGAFRDGLPTTTVTATTSRPTARLQIAGRPAESGKPSAPIRLAAGINVIDVIVTAADARTTARYAIAVTTIVSDYVKASAPTANAGFGGAVATTGDTVAVAAGGESQYDGGVHVFRRSGDAWHVEAHLTPPTPGLQASFGSSIALSGETLAVGSARAVFLFTRSGTTWTLQATVKAATADEDSGFGRTIALSNDTLVVSSVLGTYVFRRAGSVWTHEALVSGEPSQVAVSGNTLAFATTAGTDPMNPVARVLVYTRAGTSWSFQATLAPPASRASYEFGNGSLTLSSDIIAVGDPADTSAATGVGVDRGDTSAPRAGAVHVFARAGTAWSHQAYLKASNTRSRALFGWAAVLDGEALIVGAPGDTSTGTGIGGVQTGTSGGGAAYVFVRQGTVWAQRSFLKASSQLRPTDFGITLAISQGAAVVGSAGDSSAAKGINGDPTSGFLPGAGAAWIF